MYSILHRDRSIHTISMVYSHRGIVKNPRKVWLQLMILTVAVEISRCQSYRKTNNCFYLIPFCLPLNWKNRLAGKKRIKNKAANFRCIINVAFRVVKSKKCSIYNVANLTPSSLFSVLTLKSAFPTCSIQRTMCTAPYSTHNTMYTE